MFTESKVHHKYDSLTNIGYQIIEQGNFFQCKWELSQFTAEILLYIKDSSVHIKTHNLLLKMLFVRLLNLPTGHGGWGVPPGRFKRSSSRNDYPLAALQRFNSSASLTF